MARTPFTEVCAFSLLRKFIMSVQAAALVKYESEQIVGKLLKSTPKLIRWLYNTRQSQSTITALKWPTSNKPDLKYF